MKKEIFLRDKKLNRLPTHPGEILKDYLEDMGLTQKELASKLGVSLVAVNEIINTKRGISVDMSIRLEKLLGVSYNFWLSMQNNYDVQKILLDKKKSKVFDKIFQFDFQSV